MPDRSRVGLAEVAAFDNLACAFGRAAKGKRRRSEVRAFEQNLEKELEALGDAIRSLEIEVGRYHVFRIHDPKPRVIHAPSFRERVLHHALMAKMGPRIDRSLVDDTYACREGKGTLAAVQRAQAHARRHRFFVKVDVRRYFDSIDHGILTKHLRRRFRDEGLLRLCQRILDGYRIAAGRGLPIGALTSQHFANLYLDALDRRLLQDPRILGMARYMDDIVWWCRTSRDGAATLSEAREFVRQALALELHPRAYVQRSAQGLSFLGYRVFPHGLRLSRRRRVRYRRARAGWERAFRLGLISPVHLQRGIEGALATIAHADSRGFRAADLARHGAVDA